MFKCVLFDLSSGYWKLEVVPEDKHKTVFITKYELFQHARMGSYQNIIIHSRSFLFYFC